MEAYNGVGYIFIGNYRSNSGVLMLDANCIPTHKYKSTILVQKLLIV
jgi:hypothetical protein